MAMDDVLSTFCFKKIPNNHFVKVERMTPDEYENGGEELTISYSYTDSPFGKTLIASTEKGICFNALSDNKVHVLEVVVGIAENHKHLSDAFVIAHRIENRINPMRHPGFISRFV